MKPKAKKIYKVFVIHGGMTFSREKKYLDFLKKRTISLEKKIRWTDDYLDKELGKNFEIVRPRMPLQDNAKYRDWKIMFERYVPFMNARTILIGSSLGGIFLAKYLSENKLPKKVLSTYIICPPFDNSIPGEELVGGFKLKPNLSPIEKNTKHLHLLFSKDDETVPVAHAEKYRAKLPNAHLVIYKSKGGHFQIKKFPEIIELIKTDVKG